MRKKNKTALRFYYMDYSRADGQSHLFAKEGGQYGKWFIANAKQLDISESFYKNAVVKDPWLNTFIFSNLFEDNAALQDPENQYSYFYVDKYLSPHLLYALNQIDPKYKNDKSFDSLSNLANLAAEKKIILLAEYDRTVGWFNFDDALAARRANLERVDTMVKKAGLK